MQTLLIVEDDFDLNHAICLALEKEGYCIFSASSVERAKEICRKEELQLIILDVNLPDGDGFSFCDWVNNEKKTPVMFLTARDLEEDALAGYDMGAVDYVTKPFSMKILLKKIDIILKHMTPADSKEYDDGWLKVDIDGAKVFTGEAECLLTPTEFRLLRQFLMNRKQLLTYDVLLERLWDGGNQFVDKHALAVNINRLRGKIEDEEHKYISNVYGMGYQWIGA